MITTGRLEPLDLTAQDWHRVLDLHASIIAIAEGLGQTTIATLDHRDFQVVRPATNRPEGSAVETRPPLMAVELGKEGSG